MDIRTEHHAYCIVDSRASVVPDLLDELSIQWGIASKGNPDTRVESFEVLGVREVRSLKEAVERKAVLGGKKIFVISARGMTREAQNALLKIVEEPPADTHFFLIIPSLEILLLTLRSRLQILSTVLPPTETKPTFRSSEFLKDPAPKRLKTIQGLLKEAEDKEEKRDLVAFLDELEQCLATEDRTLAAPALQEVLEIKKYSKDRAPSFKLLLEHLALILPRMK